MKQSLDSVRVWDLSRMLTGGYATMLLGDLGAEVIKIEPPLPTIKTGSGNGSLGGSASAVS